jgi:Bax protein
MFERVLYNPPVSRAGMSAKLAATKSLRASAIVAAIFIAAASIMAPARAQSVLPSNEVQSIADLDYNLDAIRAGAPVPYLVAGEMPDGLKELQYSNDKKEAFFKTVLPLILSVNDDILITRAYLLKINRAVAAHQPLTSKQKGWLYRLADYYGVQPNDRGILDLSALIPRVDIIPPSLAMAQGAEESGFGTSRFAEKANALFGQLTKDASEGITTNAPELRGTGYLVKSFMDIRGSISSYARNLNTHAAYDDFRRMRAAERIAKQMIDSTKLAETLVPYCGCGPSYVTRLQNLITNNRLQDFDYAVLLTANPPQ